MSARFQLAQMNIGTALHPLDEPGMAGFMSRLDEINALAERSPGFVWRLKTDAGNATAIKLTEDPLFIVNMSVWESAETLFDFVYRTAHTPVMAQRRRWFAHPDQLYQVLWWIEAGKFPAPRQGLDRLERLRRHGPTPHAFTFKQKFPPPQAPGTAEDLGPEKFCLGWA